MFIVQVFIQVKLEAIEAFKEATLENARSSLQEPGVRRFDLLQETGKSTQFVLWEVYADARANANHKTTAHYARWKETVEEMMAKPRYSLIYHNIFPGDEDWQP
ncbi:MAG TPA: antibiotic biosynthesis monooxygenase [Anaerolineales bacterium]|nr:antibiotic biosynthesis monooxygenase [Anaerolineales bacterium]